MIANQTVAAALTDYIVARRMARAAYRAYNEAVQDLLPGEDAKRERWQQLAQTAEKMRSRVEVLANAAVQNSLYPDGGDYYSAVMDEAEVWKVTRP